MAGKYVFESNLTWSTGLSWAGKLTFQMIGGYIHFFFFFKEGNII